MKSSCIQSADDSESDLKSALNGIDVNQQQSDDQNIYQVRARPKDQSSDEDENEEKQQSATSMQSDLPKEVDTQSVSNDIDDLKQHFDGNDVEQKSVDFSMFQSKGNKCGGNVKETGIVHCCDAVKRLGAALQAYSVLNSKLCPPYNGNDDEMEPEIQTFSEFVGSEYRLQFIEDFNHFMEVHQYFAEEIKHEMIKLFGLKRCNAMDCALTMRHFGGRREVSELPQKEGDVRIQFYRQKFDSLHFQIFHLEESGYRYRSKSKHHDIGDESDGGAGVEDDNQKDMDRELANAVTSINDKKKKCDLGRFRSDEQNKFTVNISGIVTMCFAEEIVFNLFLSFILSQNMDGPLV